MSSPPWFPILIGLAAALAARSLIFNSSPVPAVLAGLFAAVYGGLALLVGARESRGADRAS